MRFVAGEREYTLRLTTNAACDLEDRTGKTLTEITLQAGRGSVSAARWLLWASLQDHHHEEVTTPQEAGRIIDAAGGLDKVNTQIAEFSALNAPDAAKANGNGALDRPPDAQLASTGAASSSMPA